MLAIDGIYNVPTRNTLSTLIQRTILHYFQCFPAEDIRMQSDHLMNLGLDCEVTAVSQSVDGDVATCVTRVRCFQVRKRIRVDVPNKSALLWMACLSQFVGNICAADLIILLAKNIYKY